MDKGKKAIKKFSKEKQWGKHVITGELEYLIPNWESITRDLETEYKFTFDEYLNDMDCRKIISEVWPLASEEQIELYSKSLTEADKRFFEHTVPVKLCIWGKRIQQTTSSSWWNG